jgi:hypothetical protein
MWQRAVLSRNGLAEKHRERPVFLWSDEAQGTVSSFDGEFMSMCRGSKCCATYLTQSLPTYYAERGGDNPRDAAHALVGKFMTHIYHSTLARIPTNMLPAPSGRSPRGAAITAAENRKV